MRCQYVAVPNTCVILDQKQSIGAAWPHIMGILSGHTYLFFTEIWPSLNKNHGQLLSPPDWFIRSMNQLAYLNPDIAVTAARKANKGSQGKNSGFGSTIIRSFQRKSATKKKTARRLGEEGLHTNDNAN